MERAREISIIVPTRALRERAALMRRALASIFGQEHVAPVPIVVVNGPDADAALVDELKSDRRVRIFFLDSADLPDALRFGRSQVDSAWFGTLDDDDVLQPDALAHRVFALEENPSHDVVVTNGLCRDAHGDVLNVTDFASVARDPLRALRHGNWLLPGSWLGRSEDVSEQLFHGMPRYLECTYLAIQFATKHRPLFLNQPTVVWHTDTPCSIRTSTQYQLGQVAAMQRLLELEVPDDVRADLSRRLGAAYHQSAVIHLRDGNHRQAWRTHCRSLIHPGGWRYLPFSRRLLLAAIREPA